MRTLALILALALPASAQDRERAEIKSKLSNLRITLDFQDAPLATIIDYIREVVGLTGSNVTLTSIALELPASNDEWLRSRILRVFPQVVIVKRQQNARFIG